MTAATIISIISGLLALVKALVGIAQERQWIDAGVAEAMQNALVEQDNAIARAKAARDATRNTNERDPNSIVRDDDGFKRPGD